MRTKTVNTAQYPDLHVDVASTLETACETGPVVLLDDDGTPQGIVFAFDEPEAAKALLASNPERFIVEVARALAESIAGRRAAL